MGKNIVITICGCKSFREQFLEIQKRLTLEGNIVISVGLFGHSGNDEVWTERTIEMLDDVRKHIIVIAKVNGYTKFRKIGIRLPV